MSKHILNSEIGLHEEWRDIPGWEGSYQASSLGRIRSLDRVGATCYGATRKLKGKLLTATAGKSGYVRVNFGTGPLLAHRLVAMAFLPNPDALPTVNHLDGKKDNNAPSNLEWSSQEDNVRHGFATGLTPKQHLGVGEKSIAAKLTEAQVRQIKARLGSGETSSKVARDFGVVKGTIREIKAGRTWGNVQ